ncbi:MAG: MmgE/PrpD family protein [Deltaproteobacteria bacterium]|nr:MmgE/PrpD family protein [Deltaproteobacteria bacterium]
MEIASEFAKFTSGLEYADIPHGAVEATKKHMLDLLGVAVAGSTFPEIKEIVEMVRELGGRETSTVIAYGGKVSSVDAAMANGAMANAGELDDVYDEAPCHPACTVVPACFAIAEQVKGVSGKELITAVTAGIDIVCRMTLATRLPAVKSGWGLTAINGYFGAAASACKILKLDEDKILNAFGIAYGQASGNIQNIKDGVVNKGLQPGFAARGGVLSGLLAQKGITGSKNSLEGQFGLYNLYFGGNYAIGPLIDDLGKRFEVTKISFKPYACCRLNHIPLDATLSLIKENDIQPQGLKEITVSVNEDAFLLLCNPIEEKRNPRTLVEAQFSLPYNIALAIIQKRHSIKDLWGSMNNPEVFEMAHKIIPKLIPEMNPKGVQPAIVEIRTNDEKVYSRQVDYASGSPQHPIDIVAKFRDCVSLSVRPLPERNIEKVIELMTKLEEVDDVSEIIRLLG